MARPPHATWYVRRVSLPPALQALTCRLGAPAHPWNERAFSYPGRCRSGNAPTLYNDFWILDAKVARPPRATWYVRRVSLPPALQALTCRLGAPAHLCDEHSFFYPGHFRSGNAPWGVGPRACRAVSVSSACAVCVHASTMHNQE